MKGSAADAVGWRKDPEDLEAERKYWGNTCTWTADLDTPRTSAALADAATSYAVDAG